MGAEVNVREGKFETALQAVARYNNDVVPLLLSHGAGVNAKGGYYGCALQAAAEAHDVDLVKLHLEHGASIDVKGVFMEVFFKLLLGVGTTRSRAFSWILVQTSTSKQASSTLQAAVSFSLGPFIEFLLDRGADVNLQGREEGSALWAAVVFPREHIIKLLLDRGADMHACQPGKYGSAFQLALGKGNLEITQLLLDYGKNNESQE